MPEYLRHVITGGGIPRRLSTVTIEHEYGSGGRHRIVLAAGAKGSWASYDEPATFDVGHKVFIGLTDFFGERVFEGRELRIIEADDDAEDVEVSTT